MLPFSKLTLRNSKESVLAWFKSNEVPFLKVMRETEIELFSPILSKPIPWHSPVVEIEPPMPVITMFTLSLILKMMHEPGEEQERDEEMVYVVLAITFNVTPQAVISSVIIILLSNIVPFFYILLQSGRVGQSGEEPEHC